MLREEDAKYEHRLGLSWDPRSLNRPYRDQWARGDVLRLQDRGVVSLHQALASLAGGCSTEHRASTWWIKRARGSTAQVVRFLDFLCPRHWSESEVVPLGRARWQCARPFRLKGSAKPYHNHPMSRNSFGRE